MNTLLHVVISKSVELRSNLLRDQLLEHDSYWHSNSARVTVHVWRVRNTSVCILERRSLLVSMELFKHHVVIRQNTGRTGIIIKCLGGKEFYIIVGMITPLQPRFNWFPGRFACSYVFLYVKTQRSPARAVPVWGCSRGSYDLMTRFSSLTADIHHFSLSQQVAFQATEDTSSWQMRQMRHWWRK